MPNDLTTAGFAPASPKKRGKKPKLNKDGSEKQPRKPTAYNAWMQAKVRRVLMHQYLHLQSAGCRQPCNLQSLVYEVHRTCLLSCIMLAAMRLSSPPRC